MVHLAIQLGRANPRLHFRIIQRDEYPERAEKAGVLATPTLVVPPLAPLAGNRPPAHVLFWLWKAATGTP